MRPISAWNPWRPRPTRLSSEGNRAELILMHSIQNPEPNQLDSAYDTLRDVVPASVGLEFKPRCIVELGTPEDAILGVAARLDADLIVLGVRSAHGQPSQLRTLLALLPTGL